MHVQIIVYLCRQKALIYVIFLWKTFLYFVFALGILCLYSARGVFYAHILLLRSRCWMYFLTECIEAGHWEEPVPEQSVLHYFMLCNLSQNGTYFILKVNIFAFPSILAMLETCCLVDNFLSCRYFPLLSICDGSFVHLSLLPVLHAPEYHFCEI